MNKIKRIVELFWVILPFVNFPIVLWEISNGVTRVQSFTGNPILLAGESMFSMFIGIALYLETREYFFLLSVILASFCELMARTDAAFLGIIIGLAVSAYGFFQTWRAS